MPYKKQSVIYMWTSPSNKVYIGQTINKKSRYNRFLDFTKSYTGSTNDFSNSYIDNARLKYNSADQWTYKVLKELPEDKEQLDYWEQYYINLYDSTNPNKGYNLTKGGNGTVGRKMSEEHLRQLRLGTKQSEETKAKIKKNAKTRKVAQYTKEGEFIRNWDSLREAAKSVGGNETSISRQCRGGRPSYKGYVWKYID